MHEFTDKDGHKWAVDLNVATMKRIRDLAKLDLANPETGDPPAIVRLDTDIILLVDVLCASILPDLERAGVSDEDFGRRLGGRAIADARAALFAELRAFFLELGRKDLAHLIDKQNRMIEAELAANCEMLADPTIDDAWTKALDRKRQSLHGRLEKALTPGS